MTPFVWGENGFRSGQKRFFLIFCPENLVESKSIYNFALDFGQQCLDIASESYPDASLAQLARARDL